MISNFIFTSYVNNYLKGQEIKNIFTGVKIDKCGLCGNFNPCVGMNKVLGTTFNDFGYFKNKDSKYLCVYCAWALKDGNIDGKASLRNFSLIVSDKDFIILKNNVIENILNYNTYPALFMVTQTYKKHIFLKSLMSYNSNNKYINTETQTIKITNEFIIIYNIVKILLDKKVKKTEMKEGLKPSNVEIFQQRVKDLLIDNNKKDVVEKYKNDILELSVYKALKESQKKDFFDFIIKYS